MSAAEGPPEVSSLTVLAPLDAVDRAQHVPSVGGMVIEGMADDEWAGFERALSDQ